MQIPAVQIENATGLNITGNSFADLGGAALEIYDRSVSNTITGNTFSDISGDGVIVDGSPGDDANADGTSQHPRGTGLGYRPIAVSESDSIKENTFTTVGAAYPDSCAILASYTDNLEIFSNDIHDVPELGIVLGVVHGTLVTKPKPGSNTDRLPTSYTLADVEKNNIYDFAEVLEDGGGIYVDGPNWKGADGSQRARGTLVERNYVHDNPFSQQDGSPTQIVMPNGSPTSLTSYAIYLETNSTGVTVASNDTFDIRSGTGARSQANHGTKLASAPGPSANELGVPVNSSSIIDQAGATPPAELDLHLSGRDSQGWITQTFTLPYAGTYEYAIRVEDVVGARCEITLVASFTDAYTVNLTPGIGAYSLLIPLFYSTSSPGSDDLKISFAGAKSASVILDQVWLVPITVNPYAS